MIDGNKVAMRWTMTGTHKGPIGQIPATGKKIKNTGITFWTIENGKIIEENSISDTLGLLQQLGLIPSN